MTLAVFALLFVLEGVVWVAVWPWIATPVQITVAHKIGTAAILVNVARVIEVNPQLRRGWSLQLLGMGHGKQQTVFHRSAGISG